MDLCLKMISYLHCEPLAPAVVMDSGKIDPEEDPFHSEYSVSKIAIIIVHILLEFWMSLYQKEGVGRTSRSQLEHTGMQHRRFLEQCGWAGQRSAY